MVEREHAMTYRLDVSGPRKNLPELPEPPLTLAPNAFIM